VTASTLDNIPRVDGVPDAELARDYLIPGRPVVIRRLYRDDPIERITSPADAIEAWGDVRLPVQLEPTTALGRSTDEPWVMPLRELLGLSGTDPLAGKKVITEQFTPAAIGAAFRPRHADLGGASIDDLVTKVFLAHAGHSAHLHYDVDGRPVFLTQIFGHERVIVIPPEQNQRLDPIVDERGGNMSSLFVEHRTPEEKLAFAREVGAFDTVLGPGETVFIPTGWWHYIDYLDTAMSFNVRLGRSPIQQGLERVAEALDSPHLHLWQRIAQPFSTGRTPSPELVARAEAVVAAVDRARETGDEADLERFAALLGALYRELAPDGYTRTLHVHDQRRRAPIEALHAPPPPAAAPDVPQGPWTSTDRPRLAPGVEVTLAVASDTLVILRDGAAEWRIEPDLDALAALRAVLALIGSAPGPTVGELADELGCDPTDLGDLLGELGRTGCLLSR